MMTATAATTAAAPATTAVMASSLIAITPPHALVLTVSHGLPVAGSCLRRFSAGSFTQLNPTFKKPSSVPTRRWSARKRRPARVTRLFRPWYSFVGHYGCVGRTNLLAAILPRRRLSLSMRVSLSLMRRWSDAHSIANDLNSAILFAV
jgi:Trk-type K+ transport system membrane component